MNFLFGDRVINKTQNEESPIRSGIYVRNMGGGMAAYVTSDGVHTFPIENLQLDNSQVQGKISKTRLEIIKLDMKAAFSKANADGSASVDENIEAVFESVNKNVAEWKR